jgi:hypothetical protein
MLIINRPQLEVGGNMRMSSAIAALVWLFFAVPAMAQDWTQVWAAGVPFTYLTSIACSADGTKLGCVE